MGDEIFQENSHDYIQCHRRKAIEKAIAALANIICNLRKRIDPDSRKPTYINTLIGVGYKFASEK